MDVLRLHHRLLLLNLSSSFTRSFVNNMLSARADWIPSAERDCIENLLNFHRSRAKTQVLSMILFYIFLFVTALLASPRAALSFDYAVAIWIWTTYWCFHLSQTFTSIPASLTYKLWNQHCTRPSDAAQWNFTFIIIINSFLIYYIIQEKHSLVKCKAANNDDSTWMLLAYWAGIELKTTYWRWLCQQPIHSQFLISPNFFHFLKTNFSRFFYIPCPIYLIIRVPISFSPSVLFHYLSFQLLLFK